MVLTAEQRESDQDSLIAYGSLTASAGFLLRLAQLRDYEAIFADREGDALAPGRLTVLRLIGLNPGIRQGELARHLFIKRAHMTKLVRQCQTQNWVRTEIPEDDKRGVILFLTREGETITQDHGDDFDRLARASMPNLSAAETDQLTSLLRKSLALPEPTER